MADIYHRLSKVAELVMQISFIIPAFNESGRIEGCLTAIFAAMKYSNKVFEVIVCDHSSKDDTAEIASKLGATVVSVPAGGTVAGVRNRGAAIAKGDLYVFLDADVEVDQSWGRELDECLFVYGEERNRIFGSLCKPPSINNYFINNWFSLIVTASRGYLGTAHMIVPKVVFDSVGGFDESLITGEDYDFCVRCRNSGFPLDFQESLIVIHDDYPKNAGEFFLRESWHGQGDFQSPSKFFRSKVAMSTVIFLIINASFAVSLFIDFNIAAFFSLTLFAFLFLCVRLKFGSISAAQALKVMPILYLYFSGRVYSFAKVFRL